MTQIQLLVASVNQNTELLPQKMNIETDAIIINQSGHYDYKEFEYSKENSADKFMVRAFDCDEKGVGLSRNMALLRADHEYVQFCDEDIVLDDGYSRLVEQEMAYNPEADIIMFNVQAAPGRETYHNNEFGRVTWLNYGRYPAYAIVARRESLHKSGVTFSLLFGGGAKYSNGEDSLFLHDCLEKKLRIYKSPISIGHEVSLRPSTWFEGYTDKFFYDRGVLYKYLYGRLAAVMGFRFLFKNRKTMCKDIPFDRAFSLLRKGIKER